MKYKYLPMVVSHFNLKDFGWTKKDHGIDPYWLYLQAHFGDKDYVFPDPKDNWFLDYSELAIWKEFANHRSKLLPKDIGLGQDDIYSEILRNIKRFEEQVKQTCSFYFIVL